MNTHEQLETFLLHVGSRLRKLREREGLTQETMSAIVGLNQSAYSRIEAGATDVTIRRLHEIAKILRTDVKTLIEGIL